MAKGFKDLPAPAQYGLIAAISIGAVAGAFYYYVWPLRAKIEKVTKEVAALRKENDQNEAFRQQREELLIRIAQLEKQLATLRTIVPDEQATDEFITMVYDAGRATGINVRTFVAQPLIGRDFYFEMPFNMRIDGNYFSMLNFFDRLAREQRIVSVANLAMGPPAGGGMGTYIVLPSETVGANCAVITYFNKPVAAPAPPAPARK